MKVIKLENFKKAFSIAPISLGLKNKKEQNEMAYAKHTPKLFFKNLGSFLVSKIFVILILNNKKPKPAYTPGVHSSLSFRISGVSGQALPETALSRIATQWGGMEKEIIKYRLMLS